MYDEDATTPLPGDKTNPVIGASDWPYSVTPRDERNRLGARLPHIDRDKLVTSYNDRCPMPPQTWSHDEASMDFQPSDQDTLQRMVTFDATNITEETYQDYDGNPTLSDLSTDIDSRTYALGLRYQLGLCYQF